MGKRGGGLSNRVHELRTMAGMTQQQLADEVGVTRQTVISIERNKYSPSLEVAFRVARALGVGIDDVFSFREPDESAETPPAVGSR